MRKLVYYIGLSIDGRIAGPAGEFDFYPLEDDLLEFITTRLPDSLPTHVRSQFGLDAPVERFGTVLMGRGTYQPGLDIGVTSPYAHLRQYVVSSTLPASDDPAVTIVSGDPLELVRRLKKEEGGDIWLCGGGKLAGELLPEIDEMIIKYYPVVAGAGIPVFAGDFQPHLFDLVDTRTFANGTLLLTYTKK
ncbi:dihydrofolate reductase family protein [Actinoallomurus rhizosphaericola]|uniref:dihydrofolate reductase family protein n=1 Tax=Actinoallomurus rhizosphaericola TaxID=2952536 RepID=UPI00209029BD|nr:dihydrofolate reductase family protein [Actinoallomurus rhizosphaericola]MCO5994033.1 dihydrofolate reductase family protein [Actinoallomurus rhizosphaericola]